MFKALKEKLKETLQKISARAEKEAAEEEDTFLKEAPVTEPTHETLKKSPFEPFTKDDKKSHTPVTSVEEQPLSHQHAEEKREEKKGFLSKLFSRKKKEETLEELPPDQVPSAVEETSKVLADTNDPRSTEYVLDEEPSEKKPTAIIPEYKKKALVDSIREEKKRQHEEKMRGRSVAVEHALEEQQPAVEPLSHPPAEEKKKGFFSFLKEKVITKRLTPEQFDELFWDLELVLLEHNVAVDVVERIKQDLHSSLVDVPLRRGKINEAILAELRKVLSQLFDAPPFDLVEAVKAKRKEHSREPYVICFVGVNGSGKTTTIAKIAHYLKSHGFQCLLVAGDTWRAASIQQLEEHAERLGLRVVKHDYGSDPAAVAFDGIKAAQARGMDIVLIDTAGRQHSNKDLMREIEKVIRVAKPDLKLFVGESITGNDCVLQAKSFDETVGIDGMILTKVDVDDKGGAALSISYVTGKPILYFGVGQSYEDLQPFDKQAVLSSLGL